jgi:iron complex transport system substrate-binding protein
VTITDYANRTVTLQLPVQRIICLDDSLGGIVCALGAQDTLIARSDGVIFPSSIMSLPSVGSSSYSFSMETVLSYNPDLVIANSMLTTANRDKLTAAGVPFIVENAGIPSRVNTVVSEFGAILGNPTKAAEINNNTQYYMDLVQTRTQNLTFDEKTTFFFEWGSTQWYSQANGSSANDMLLSCGGVNIAASSTVAYPTLSAEFVAEADPDVIILAVSGTTNLTDYQNAWDSMVSRTALQDASAVKSSRVYVIYIYLTYGIRYPVGELYFAKWLYPDLFADIDPGAIYTQLVQEYFGITLTGTYVYTSSSTPAASQAVAANALAPQTSLGDSGTFSGGLPLAFKPELLTADSPLSYKLVNEVQAVTSMGWQSSPERSLLAKPLSLP